MKKIFLSSLSLLAFSVSIILFQISCKKEAKAVTTTTSTTASQQNKILYGDWGDKHSGPTYWIANYDGTDAQKINITVPAGSILAGALISPDGKTVFVTFEDTTKGNNSIYACNADGSNLHLVTAGSSSSTTTTAGPIMFQAY